MTHVACYGLGGGRGHAVRTSALTRALIERGVRATVLVRQENRDIAEAFEVPHRACPRPEGPERLRTWLEAVSRSLQPTHLVVDTFPEGLLGELRGALLELPRTVLLRTRRDAHAPAFRAAIRPTDRCLDLEPHLGWAPEDLGLEAFGPVARNLATATPEHDVVFVPGEAPRIEPMTRLARRLRVAGLDAVVVPPSSRLSRGPELSAKVVVGAAGFNLTYELARLGVHHVALPLHRSHDDQHRRAATMSHRPRSPEALERLVVQLARGAGHRSSPVAVQDPSALAATVLESAHPIIRSRYDTLMSVR